MSAINAINLSRFFFKFRPQDPDPDPDPWTQKNADPADPGSASLVCKNQSNKLTNIYMIYCLGIMIKNSCTAQCHENL